MMKTANVVGNSGLSTEKGQLFPPRNPGCVRAQFPMATGGPGHSLLADSGLRAQQFPRFRHFFGAPSGLPVSPKKGSLREVTSFWRGALETKTGSAVEAASEKLGRVHTTIIGRG